MGFLRGNLCVRARYPIRGMLGITARRLARVFEDFDRTRSPRNGFVRDFFGAARGRRARISSGVLSLRRNTHMLMCL